MKKPWLTIHGVLVALGVVVLAGALTIPWSYLVLRAAYERDIAENAKSLARRVEQSVVTRVAIAEARGFNTWVMRPGQAVYQEVLNALGVEMSADPTIRAAVFFYVTYTVTPDGTPLQPDDVLAMVQVRKDASKLPLITAERIEQLTEQNMQGKDADSYRFLLPWRVNSRVRGATYLELSLDRISKDFWVKEGALLKQVVAWTATGIIALSSLGMFAYGAWQRAGNVQRQAELTRQGMLAERGLTAAVLAHEIRNPLAALRFQLHSLRKHADAPDRVNSTAQTIDSELLRIQQLVTDYLEHEKAASLRVQSVDLVDAAQKLRLLMEDLMRSTDTKLMIVPPAEASVHAVCDPHALRQILMNLVLNAQQAMVRGGSVTIQIGKSHDGYGTIDVSDTGPGIPEEMRARLFKPFQTTKREGHGIGLALVKRFVDNFGGSVTVYSELGKGTTFHLKLPLTGADGSPETLSAESEALSQPDKGTSG